MSSDLPILGHGWRVLQSPSLHFIHQLQEDAVKKTGVVDFIKRSCPKPHSAHGISGAGQDGEGILWRDSARFLALLTR